MKPKILITSPPDRENLVAEIWIDDCQFAEVSQEGDERLVEIYPHPRGGPWQIAFSEILEVLERSRARLDEMGEGAGPP